MISQVTVMLQKNGEAREVWFLFETKHASLFELNETLATDGTAFGERIDTMPAGQGRRVETGRYEYILGTSAVSNISAPQFEFIPASAAPAAQVQA